MQSIAALRRPPSLSIQLLRQRYKPTYSNPRGRSLTTCQTLWRPRSTPSRYQPARRTISDSQTYRDRKNGDRKYREGQSDSGAGKTGGATMIIILGVGITTLPMVYMTSLLRHNEKSGRESAQKFHSFTLISKEPISSTSAIFTLRPSTSFLHRWDVGVWSVEFKQPELQISRDYTPLPPLDFDGNLKVTTAATEEDLKFLIRKEHKGEVSNYLYGLPVGATVEIRGPKYSWVVPKAPLPKDNDEIDQVIFLAGGTGIAPALQVARSAVEMSQDLLHGNQRPKVCIIWANRRREDCGGPPNSSKGWFHNWWWADASSSASPSANTGSLSINVQYPPSQDEDAGFSCSQSILGLIVSSTAVKIIPQTQLQPETEFEPNPIISTLSQLSSKFPSMISIDYKVDEENTFIQPKEIQQLVEEANNSKGKGKKIIMVCGPEGFVNAISGPRSVFKDGREVKNEEVGGILGNGRLGNKIRQGRWEVVRL